MWACRELPLIDQVDGHVGALPHRIDSRTGPGWNWGYLHRFMRVLRIETLAGVNEYSVRAAGRPSVLWRTDQAEQ
jgi:hypothetical protein